MLRDTAEKDGIDCNISIETGIAAAGKLLMTEYEEQLKGFIVERAMPVRSKEDRATPFRNAIMDGHIYLNIDNESQKTLLEELRGFPFAPKDDQVDAVSHGYNYLCRQEKGHAPDLIFIDF